MQKVVIAKAKLKGNETDTEIYCMLSAHYALSENGFISNCVICDKSGNPEFIQSVWKLSKYDDGNLPNGQRYGYISDKEGL